MFLNTGDKRTCSGCSGCLNICSHDAIKFDRDKNGFSIPVKDVGKCVDCGLCEKVCPIEHPDYSNSPKPKPYAAYDPKERQKSSSGGVFYTIAKHIIENDGIVYGAAFDKKLKLHHIGVNTIEGLEALRGSKYVQSELGYTYKDIRKHLKNGRKVYFVGTPCQVAGLKSFLMRDYYNLITSDLVCHGVPSQTLFEKHLNYLKSIEGSDVTNYSFRDTNYWVIREKANYDNGNVSIKYDGNTSPYLFAFGLGYSYRDCCFDCKFAKIPRQGDITLADFWGIGRFHPTMNNRGGVSMVLINSDKGEMIWNNVKSQLKYKVSDIEACTKYNPNIIRPTKEPLDRIEFLRQIQSEPYYIVAKEMLQCPPSLRNRRIERKMKLRKYGLLQPIEAIWVGIKKIIGVLHLNKIAYDIYSERKFKHQKYIRH